MSTSGLALRLDVARLRIPAALDADHAGVQIDVGPSQRLELPEAQASVEGRRPDRPESGSPDGTGSSPRVVRSEGPGPPASRFRATVAVPLSPPGRMRSTWFLREPHRRPSPQPLAGHGKATMSEGSIEVRQVRLAQNQSLFRSVNERVGKVVQKLSANAPVSFMCECAIVECARQIELGHEEYEAIRQNPARFFVRPDHVFPEVEVVVEYRGQYVVVEKFGIGGRVATAADRRQLETDAVR